MKENKIVCEERTDEGIRLFKGDVCGTLRTIDACGDKRVIEVRQAGNLTHNAKRENPQRNRVYDKNGLSPTLNCMEGGNLQPMIIEPVLVMDYRYDEGCRVRKDGTSPALNASKTGSTSPSGQTLLVEPMIVASRGRNKQNPSDRTPGTEVEQRLEPNSQGICNTLTSVQKDNWLLEPAILTPKRTEYGKSIRKDYESGKVQESRHNMTELQPREDGISNTLTTVQKDNYLLEPTIKIKQATSEGYIECKLGGVADLSYPTSKTRRGRVQENGDICPTLMAAETEVYKIESQYRIRKLTPLECWRLMGFSDEDFYKAEKVNSNSQLYKQAGNSIVVDVLEGIFKRMI